MSGLTGRPSALTRAFGQASTVAAVPSSAGLHAFRQLQQRALAEFTDEVKLTDHARRVRNRLLAVAASVSIGMAAAVAIPTGSKPDPAAAVAVQGVQIETAVVAMEKAASDLYYSKASGASAVEQAGYREALRSAAGAVRQELVNALADGRTEDVKSAVARVRGTADSDLGRLGVDIAESALPDLSKVQAFAQKPLKVASRRSSPGPEM